MKTDRPYICPVEATLSQVGGKYKMIIVYHLLRFGTLRFSELQKRMPSATAKMLTQQLRQLEEDGLVRREVFPVVPPRTEYSLTERGKSLAPIASAMVIWGLRNMYGTFHVWNDERDTFLSGPATDEYVHDLLTKPEALQAAVLRHAFKPQQ
jgi:DNA-binding HxlR family transcriptional regulator